ncbi:hypothetical protein G7Y79_00049g084480 [Physcia stellaris]|nr:hypothetical protein G7Y79_00049g084480 [Physcia stellaris]
MFSTSRYTITSLTDHWPYKYPTVSQMRDAQLYMAKDTHIKGRRVVGCQQCKFLVPVDKWPYNANPSEEHADTEQTCLAEAARLAEQARIAKQHEEARLAKERVQQQKERAEAEAVRIAKEQQEAEQARLEAFACRRCPAKFPSNTKLHIHVQDHHQKTEKPASEIKISSPSEPAMPTPNEPAKTTPTAASAPITPPLHQKRVRRTHTKRDRSTYTPCNTSTNGIDLRYLTSFDSTCHSNIHVKCNTTKADILGRNSLTPSRCTKAFASPSAYNKHPKHHTKNDAHSRTISSSSYQAKITAYFRPAANQSKPISQGSKTPNPRSFQQHMPAESNRAKSTPTVLSDRTMACIGTYEQSISAMHLAMDLRSMRPGAIPWLGDP